MAPLAAELKFPVPWGHISAQSWGSPTWSPVLLVHGTLDNAGSFSRLIPLLPQGFYYVAIDLPSHGLSSHFPSGLPLDFFNFVLSLHYVLDALAWDSCLYIGHSFGAQLGVMYSVLCPGRLKKIIALDALISRTFTPDETSQRSKQILEATVKLSEKREPTLHSKEKIIETLQRGRQFELNRAAAEAIFVRGTTQVGDKYRYNRDVRMRLTVTLLFTLEQNLAFLKRLNCPILLIIPENSWFDVFQQREALERVTSKLTNWITLIGVPGNHDVHNNDPEVIAPHVASFFTEQKSKL